MTFSDVVETIKSLSLEEKQQIKALLAQYFAKSEEKKYTIIIKQVSKKRKQAD